MSKGNQSYIEAHAGGGVSFVGSDAVTLMQATVLKHALTLYAKSGLLMARNAKPTQMLRIATSITKKPYKRGQYVQAAEDLQKWADTMNAALPHVHPHHREEIQREVKGTPDGKTHIDVFRASDGKWTYCPSLVRASPTMHRAFTMTGQFETQRQCMDVLLADTTIPTDAVVHVEDEMGPAKPE